jgi:hypothetical protein
MKIILLDSIISPDWLKYGFIGLVAIVILLFYFTIKPLIKNEKNKKFWVFVFLGSGLILLILGGISSYFNDKMKAENKRQIDSVAIANLDLQKKLAVYTDSSPEGQQLLLKMEENKRKFDSLVNINKQLENDISKNKDVISELILYNIIPALESDLRVTSGKGQYAPQIEDINYKRLRRAIFLNFMIFNADINILKQTLNIYNEQTKEFSPEDINKIISDFSNLMRVRLTWLKQEAIPALEADIRHLEEHPMEQRAASAIVKLPKEAIIFEVSNDLGSNTVMINNITILEKEKNLLMKKLSATTP